MNGAHWLVQALEAEGVDALFGYPGGAVLPVYEELAGWAKPVRHVRAWDDLPEAAVRFVRRVEEVVQVPVSIVSTGRDRMATFLAPATG